MAGVAKAERVRESTQSGQRDDAGAKPRKVDSAGHCKCLCFHSE